MHISFSTTFESIQLRLESRLVEIHSWTSRLSWSFMNEKKNAHSHTTTQTVHRQPRLEAILSISQPRTHCTVLYATDRSEERVKQSKLTFFPPQCYATDTSRDIFTGRSPCCKQCRFFDWIDSFMQSWMGNIRGRRFIKLPFFLLRCFMDFSSSISCQWHHRCIKSN